MTGFAAFMYFILICIFIINHIAIVDTVHYICLSSGNFLSLDFAVFFTKYIAIEGLHEYISFFFRPSLSGVLFRCSVYWWKGSVRF